MIAEITAYAYASTVAIAYICSIVFIFAILFHAIKEREVGVAIYCLGFIFWFLAGFVSHADDKPNPPKVNPEFTQCLDYAGQFIDKYCKNAQIPCGDKIFWACKEEKARLGISTSATEEGVK